MVTFITLPNRLCCCRRIWPLPPQVGQVFVLLPGFAPLPPQVSQFSCREMLISRLTPKAASSKEILTLTSTSPPRIGPFLWAVRPPPKKLSKISPKPPKPSKPPKPPPYPAPPALPSKAAEPNWSYCARFLSSESTWYASFTSLNFCAALSSSLFISG